MNHSPITKVASALVCVSLIVGCTAVPPRSENMPLLSGPPIRDIETSFDRALLCLRGKVSNGVTFSVGAVLDLTGKDQLTEGGTGKFVTQGAGEIVQSALFTAGLTVLNRRDPRVIEQEIKLGIRPAKQIRPSSYFVTGSINSLDFLPGGGFDARIAGVGPAYRQNRILVGLDLFLTETRTGRVVSSIGLQKQLYTSEFGFSVGRFIGESLVNIDLGWKEREAVNFAMRQMLNLATFELLTQVMTPQSYEGCREEIASLHGGLDSTPSAIALKNYRDAREINPVAADAPTRPSEPVEPPRTGSGGISSTSAPRQEQTNGETEVVVRVKNGFEAAKPETPEEAEITRSETPAEEPPEPSRNILIIQ